MTMQTAEPVAIFMILMVFGAISPNDTSIDLCRENIDTNASAKEMFLNVLTLADTLRLDFPKFTDANVIFVKA